MVKTTVRGRVGKHINRSVGRKGTKKNKAVVASRRSRVHEQIPQSGSYKTAAAEIACRVIQEATDYTQAMVKIFQGVLAGTIDPKIANSAVHAGSRAMHCVELDLRYGPEFRRVFASHMGLTLNIGKNTPKIG